MGICWNQCWSFEHAWTQEGCPGKVPCFCSTRLMWLRGIHRTWLSHVVFLVSVYLPPSFLAIQGAVCHQDFWIIPPSSHGIEWFCVSLSSLLWLFLLFEAYKVKMNVMIYGAAMSACEQSGCWQMALGLLSHMGSEAWKRSDGDEVLRIWNEWDSENDLSHSATFWLFRFSMCLVLSSFTLFCSAIDITWQHAYALFSMLINWWI